MQLLSDELLKLFEAQGNTSHKEAKDIKVIAKYFNPCGSGTWYAVEYLPDERIFFGYANLGNADFAELGYFSLDELESFAGLFGLGIERDLFFKECTLQEVIDSKGTI